MSDRYERVYDVALLDDLHNYFPALLYHHDIFRTVPDVLLYIRERTLRRFNLFDYGRRQYESSIPLRTAAPFGRRQTANPIVEEPNVEFSPNTPVTSLSTLIPLLRTLNNPIRARATHNLYEDVVVHATQNVINMASTETTLVEDFDDNCTICQDRMRQNELVRTLTACEHTFHRACIDNWLLTRSVICPTCRHDIRLPEAEGRRSRIQSPLLGAASPPNNVDALRDLDNMLPEDMINLLFGRRLA